MSHRLRIKYSKDQALRFTSTLNMQKMWERIFRRANFPLLYSKGFHPQPKIQLACPLPLGLTSIYEIVDCWLEEYLEEQHLIERLNQSIPSGIGVIHVKWVSLDEPAMQTRLLSSIYLAAVDQNNYSLEEINKKLEEILSAQSLIRIRRNKKYDLRPLIKSLKAFPGNRTVEILMELSADPGGPHGRPDEVLSAIGIDPMQSSIQRKELVFSE